MKIKWLGHASFLITSGSGLKIVTDPYMAGYKDLISYAPIKEAADIVTISHQHGDHNYPGDLLGNPQVIQGLGKHLVKGIEFVGIACFHDRVQGGERGPNTIFSFTIDGIRVCHLGDLGHPLDDSSLKSLGRPDILLMPAGGPRATFELDEALALCDKLQPHVMIPMHFRNQKCNFPKYGLEDLLKLRPEAVRAGKTEVEFTAGRLPKSQVLILEPAL